MADGNGLMAVLGTTSCQPSIIVISHPAISHGSYHLCGQSPVTG